MDESIHTKNMKTYTHTSETYEGQLADYEKRAAEVDLTWCRQVFSIIDRENRPYEQAKINDIGCNYFQLFKEIKRQKAVIRYDYNGYDVDAEFLRLGLKYFPELEDRQTLANVEEIEPRPADFSVISATLEHADNPQKLLRNVLKTTRHMIVLRTFFGDQAIKQLQDDKRFVTTPYYINQFSLVDTVSLFMKYGFVPEIIPDIATNNSTPYEVGGASGIWRQMFLLVGKKAI